MAKKNNLVIVLGFTTIFFILISQILLIDQLSGKNSLSFEDEDVIITLTGDDALFTARYGLKNYGMSNSFVISLPFASRPWDINLTFNGISLEYSWMSSIVPPETEVFDTIIFRVNIEPNQEGDILVSYKRNYSIIIENEITSIIYRYIVGSTRSWNAPLIFAHFEFWLQEGSIKTLLESRDYTNWLPTETFLYFRYTP